MKEHFSTNSFIAGIMLGVLLTGAWFFQGADPRRATTSSPQATTTTPRVAQGSGSISVSNQTSGDMVTVESVTVPPPGVWVAVREMNGNELGNVLGAARVNGPKSEISVSLLRATKPGSSYAVQLYRDNGTGVFDSSINSVYVDFDTGTRVVAYFTATE